MIIKIKLDPTTILVQEPDGTVYLELDYQQQNGMTGEYKVADIFTGKNANKVEAFKNGKTKATWGGGLYCTQHGAILLRKF